MLRVIEDRQRILEEVRVLGNDLGSDEGDRDGRDPDKGVVSEFPETWSLERVADCLVEVDSEHEEPAEAAEGRHLCHEHVQAPTIGLVWVPTMWGWVFMIEGRSFKREQNHTECENEIAQGPPED